VVAYFAGGTKSGLVEIFLDFSDQYRGLEVLGQVAELLDQGWPEQIVIEFTAYRRDVLGGDFVGKDASFMGLETGIGPCLRGLGWGYGLAFVIGQGESEIALGVALAGMPIGVSP
jgi:hypothetical protein